MMIERMQNYIGIESLIPTVGIFALSFYLYYSRQQKKNYPPGPKGLPVLGCVTQLGEHPANTLTSLAEKYGNVFSIQIGLNNWVILNDYESIHKALLKKDDDFSGRPDILMLRKMGQGLGVIFRNHGPEFKSQKKFTIATLRRFGAKNRLEDLVLAEVNHLADEIQSQKGKSFNSQKLLVKAFGNIIFELILGSRFTYDNPTYTKLVAGLDNTFFKETTVPGILALVVAPIVRFFPGFREIFSSFCKDLDSTFEILGQLLETHKKNFDDNDIRDFVDTFIHEMRSNANKDPSFKKDRQIFQLMRELYVAGSVNTSVTLRWCLLCFANHPGYQEKIHKEVENIIGESGTSTMKHRDVMPFTNAFIHEILRHRTLVPFGMPHSTTTNTTLEGYEIPKNTPVLTNLWAAMHDPKHFKDPEVFKPERFLDDDGKFIADPHVIAFSIGPRYCLGDQMAKVELFMFLTAIVQRFKIIPDPKKPLPSFDDGVFGVVYVPRDFDVIFESR